MDEKQMAEYLADSFHCPYCKSQYIAARDFNSGSFTQLVECLSCGKEWKDVYTLAKVEPIESKPS